MRLVIFATVFVLTKGQYHNYEKEDPDRIIFEDEPTRSSNTRRVNDGQEEGIHHSESSGEPSELSVLLKFAKRMSLTETTDDFLAQVIGVPTPEQDSFINSRIGGVERSNIKLAKQAICKPEQQIISLKERSKDHSIVYFPSCTRVERCGGCCDHALLSCQPNITAVINVQIIVTNRDANLNLIFKEKEIMPLEKHISCACDCKIKAEHCTEKQEYIPEECRCVCKNVDERAKCKRFHDTKLWDPEKCACNCRRILACSTGSYFDQDTCRCERD